MNIKEIKFDQTTILTDSATCDFSIKDIAKITFSCSLEGGSMNGEITIDKDDYIKNATCLETFLANKIAKKLL